MEHLDFFRSHLDEYLNDHEKILGSVVRLRDRIDERKSNYFPLFYLYHIVKLICVKFCQMIQTENLSGA